MRICDLIQVENASHVDTKCAGLDLFYEGLEWCSHEILRTAGIDAEIDGIWNDIHWTEVIEPPVISYHSSHANDAVLACTLKRIGKATREFPQLAIRSHSFESSSRNRKYTSKSCARAGLLPASSRTPQVFLIRSSNGSTPLPTIICQRSTYRRLGLSAGSHDTPSNLGPGDGIRLGGAQLSRHRTLHHGARCPKRRHCWIKQSLSKKERLLR